MTLQLDDLLIQSANGYEGKALNVQRQRWRFLKTD
jgi:hypothetical protein